MKRYLLLLCVLLFGISLKSQSYTYHYWFDTDIDYIQNGDLGDGNLLLNVSTLDFGLHLLNIMLKDEAYSVTERYLFYKVKTEQPNYLYCHWFDNDVENLQTNSLGDGVLLLDVNALTTGLHWLNILLKDGDNSVTERYLFYKTEEQNITSLNYWFDEEASGSHNVAFTGGAIMIDISELSIGEHVVNLQMIKGLEQSVPERFTFYRSPVVRVFANPEDGGEVSLTVNDDIYTITAVANPYYYFENWMSNSSIVSTDAVYSFSTNEDTDFTANFGLNSYTITAAADPESGGTIIGAGTYNYGETATLSVTLNDNFTFVSWTENGNVVSTDATYSFEVTGDRNLVANLMDHQGVGEMAAGDFRIYPNPADDIIFIESGMEICRCEIYTETGRLVYQANDCLDRFEINVENLSAGTYIIRLVSDGVVHNRRFVKK